MFLSHFCQYESQDSFVDVLSSTYFGFLYNTVATSSHPLGTSSSASIASVIQTSNPALTPAPVQITVPGPLSRTDLGKIMNKRTCTDGGF